MKIDSNTNLVKAREDLGLSAPQMAQALNGTPYTSYFKAEKGERRGGGVQALMDPAVRWVSWQKILQGKDPRQIAANLVAQAITEGLDSEDLCRISAEIERIAQSESLEDEPVLLVFRDEDNHG